MLLFAVYLLLGSSGKDKLNAVASQADAQINVYIRGKVLVGKKIMMKWSRIMDKGSKYAHLKNLRFRAKNGTFIFPNEKAFSKFYKITGKSTSA